MDLDDSELFPLRPSNIGINGKRSYDVNAKKRLVQFCLRSGQSIARLAMKADINANQLRNWIEQYKDEIQGTDRLDGTEPSQTAFIPVVEALGGRELSVAQGPRDQQGTAAMRVSIRLPNGACMDLECCAADVALVAAVIDSLGRSHVPARH